MAQLIQLRTNTRFNLSYEEHKLEPEIELIFIISKPEYVANEKKGTITKTVGVSEVRIDTTPSGLTKIIGQLQSLQSPVNSFENMAEAFNAIIVNSKPKEDK